MENAVQLQGTNVVGVQFRRAGKIYDFAAGSLSLRVGDDVVVETERGPALARVAAVKYLENGPATADLKPIERRAGSGELKRKPKVDAAEAERVAREKIAALKLDMRVLKAEVQFGGNKVVIFFSAPGRVDFRELVKHLATTLRARVELKQVGARDEAKILGGMGICGREFCCSSFLREFVPVSIKMAKNQNLALNPSKVSGGCGRLLCCLTYENDTYTHLRQQLPPRGTRVRHVEEDRLADVVRSDLLNQLVIVEDDEGAKHEWSVRAIEVVEKGTGVEEDSWVDDIDLEALMDDGDAGASSTPAESKESGQADAEGRRKRRGRGRGRKA